jgi:AcrR family transcriptional regulator
MGLPEPAVVPALDDEICGKAAQIITAARDAFLEQGYDAVSMDAVAKRAGVAKQTVYAHFASKESLFLAVVKGEQRRIAIAMPEMPAEGRPAVREVLRDIGQRYIDSVLNSSVISIFRLAVAEANRFPTLGRSIREAGMKQTSANLAGILERAGACGGLIIPDPMIAAAHFLALVRGDLHIHCMLDASFRPPKDQINRQIDAALDCFLARYGEPA